VECVRSRCLLTLGLALRFLVAAGIPTAAQETEGQDVFSDPLGGEEPLSQSDESAGFNEDFPTVDDFDSLFEQNDIIDESMDTSGEENPQDDLLFSEAVQWGGSLSGSVSADWTWFDPWNGGFALLDPTSQSLTPHIGTDLFFDARPEPEFRAFGKLKIDTTTDGILDLSGLSLTEEMINTSFLPAGWTAVETKTGEVEIRNQNGVLIATIPADAVSGTEEKESDTGVSPGLAIEVFELFADYAYKDTLFFRFGKHTIHWGNGYFFSPADVLNITSIDPEDPTVDRQGPVSLRIAYPFGLTGNANLYLIVNDQIEPLDIAVAPKVEFVVGPGELGIGGYYQRELSPRLLALYSFSLGEVDFFSEAVLLVGSDRVFVQPSRDQSVAEADPDDGLDLVLNTYTADNALYAQATLGARYLKEWENVLSLLVVGQYFFNGDGYADDEEGILPAAFRLLFFPQENGLALEPDERPEDYEPPPALSLTDLSHWGRHYVAATVATNELFGTDLGVSLFGMMNLSDLSGIISPSISYSFLERFSLSLSFRFTFGDENDELTDPESFLTGSVPAPTFGINLSLKMPGGPF
jgi:hypothetical protein